MSQKNLFFFVLLILAGLSSRAYGCLYFKSDMKLSSFRENDREALMFHDGEAVNLILKTGFSGKLPKTLAWVFPVASKPLGYKVSSPQIFKVLNVYFERDKSKGYSLARGVPKGAAKSPGIKIHETEHVGQYEIIPIEILSESSGLELNDWLKNQGFNASPLEIQKPYLKKGSFFLAIRANLSGDDAQLEPLWVRYKASSMSFPLRFTHDYRSFNLNLYFLAEQGKKRHLPEGLGWGESTRMTMKTISRYSGALSQVANEKLKFEETDDQFSSLMNLLIEFRNVQAVDHFLNQKNLVLTKMTIQNINSEATAKLYRTKNLKRDPSAEM